MTSINLGKFAESLGLATTPRVRFLDRQNKLKSKVIRKDEKVEQVKPGKVEHSSELEVDTKLEKAPDSQEFGNFHRGEAESGDEEDIFTVKRRDHKIDDDNEDEEEAVDLQDDDGSKKSKQVLTKAQVAKKLLKKKIKANVKINFDEEGEAVDDSTKQKVSVAGKKYEEDLEESLGGGIDIKKAKEIMSEEDRCDILISFLYPTTPLKNILSPGLTRQQREHESRKSTERRRGRRKRRTGDFPRRPGVKRMKKMMRRKRREVNLISVGFLILTCSMVKRVVIRRRRKKQRRRWS